MIWRLLLLGCITAGLVICGCISESSDNSPTHSEMKQFRLYTVSGSNQKIEISYPYVSLIVSGIHNEIILDSKEVKIKMSGIQNTVYIPEDCVIVDREISGIQNKIIRGVVG